MRAIDIYDNSTELIFGFIDLALIMQSKQYKRSYGKFIEILTGVGGLWSAIFLMSGIIVKPFSKFLYFLEVLNIIYQKEDKAKLQKNNKTVNGILKKRHLKYHKSNIEQGS